MQEAADVRTGAGKSWNFWPTISLLKMLRVIESASTRGRDGRNVRRQYACRRALRVERACDARTARCGCCDPSLIARYSQYRRIRPKVGERHPISLHVPTMNPPSALLVPCVPIPPPTSLATCAPRAPEPDARPTSAPAAPPARSSMISSSASSPGGCARRALALRIAAVL